MYDHQSHSNTTKVVLGSTSDNIKLKLFLWMMKMTKSEYIQTLKTLFKDNEKIQKFIEKEDISSLYFELVRERNQASFLTLERLNEILAEDDALSSIKKIVDKNNKIFELYNQFEIIFADYKEDYWY